MPSISTCIISQLTALQRDCLIWVNSIPQPCRTLQRSKCQDGGMRKIKKRAYVGSNGGEQQMEFTDTQENPDVAIFSAAEWSCIGTYTKKNMFWLTLFLLFDCSGWERCWSPLPLVCVFPQICESAFVRGTVASCVCLCKGIHLCFCALRAYRPLCQFANAFLCIAGVCLPTGVCACVWVCPLPINLPLCAHILLLNGHTGHFAQPDAHLDVSELQAQVLPQDGHPGSPLARPRLREQLEQARGWRMEVGMDGGGEKGMEEQGKSVQKRDKRTGRWKGEGFYLFDHCTHTHTEDTEWLFHMLIFTTLKSENSPQTWHSTDPTTQTHTQE